MIGYVINLYASHLLTVDYIICQLHNRLCSYVIANVDALNFSKIFKW